MQHTCTLCDADAARGRGGEASDELQQSGLPCPAAPIDQTQLPGRHSEGDVLQQGRLSACAVCLSELQ